MAAATNGYDFASLLAWAAVAALAVVLAYRFAMVQPPSRGPSPKFVPGDRVEDSLGNDHTIASALLERAATGDLIWHYSFEGEECGPYRESCLTLAKRRELQ